jgi:hypothetical protein
VCAALVPTNTVFPYLMLAGLGRSEPASLLALPVETWDVTPQAN